MPNNFGVIRLAGNWAKWRDRGQECSSGIGAKAGTSSHKERTPGSCRSPTCDKLTFMFRILSRLLCRPISCSTGMIQLNCAAALGLFVLTTSSSANTGSEFSYDRQLAVELAISYTKSEFRRSPKIALPGVDYKHPNTLTIIDKSKRRLVFVSFSSSKPSDSSSGEWGVVAVFQLCKEPKTLRMIDLYTVDPIESE